jgi:hypothetical protein
VSEFEKGRFILYHCVSFVGLFAVLADLNVIDAFPLLTSFTIGSFTLVIAGFFVTNPNTAHQYRILLFTLTGTLIFFLAGIVTGVHSIFTNFAKFGWLIASVSDSLFLVGIADLIVVIMLLYQFVEKEYADSKRAVPKP